MVYQAEECWFTDCEFRQDGDIISAVCAGVLSFLLIEMIYRRDIRRIFRHPWQLLLLAAGALVLTLALRNDWFRYDRYLPERDKIVSVVYEDERHGGNTGAEYVSTGREVWWAGDGRTEEMRSAPDAMAGKESIDAAYDFAKAGIERALKMRRGEDESVISYYYDNVTKPTAESVKPVEMEKELYTMSSTVTWHLASGRTVMRRYNVPVMQNLQTIETLCRDEAVKKQIFPVLALPDSIADRIVYNELGYETPAAENAAQISEFLAAYRADVSAAAAEDLMEYPSALIMIYLTEEGDAAFTRTNRWVLEQTEETESFLSYPIYPSFTATREVLKRFGITEGEAREAIMAEAVTEGRQWVVYEGASEILPEGASGVIGPHEAEILKDYIISTDYSEYGFSWMNPNLPMALQGVYVRHFDTDWEVLIAWTPETQALMEELLRTADTDSRGTGQSRSGGVG